MGQSIGPDEDPGTGGACILLAVTSIALLALVVLGLLWWAVHRVWSLLWQ